MELRLIGLVNSREGLVSEGLFKRFVPSRAFSDFVANNCQMCARNPEISLKKLNSTLMPSKAAAGG